MRKKVDEIQKCYDTDLQKSSKAIFGNAIHPQYWKTIGHSPKEVIAHFFRNPSKDKIEINAQPAASFEILKHMSDALPQRGDRDLLRPISLVRDELTFNVPCFQDRVVEPYPRLTVNGDPFWLPQRTRSHPTFLWKDAFIWSSDKPAEENLETKTTTATSKIKITLSTNPIQTKSKKNAWEYHVKIENCGEKGVDPSCQLLSRHWYFFEGETGKILEVVGSGVLGELPVLHPGETHSYVSGTEMTSSSGAMKGHFQMARFYTAPLSEEKAGKERAQSTPKKEDKLVDGQMTEYGHAERFVDMIDVFIAPTLLTR